MANVTVSANRMKSLLAAEEFCRAARIGIVDRGFVGRVEYPWFERWMRLSGRAKYDQPKRVPPVWCGSCKKRHVAGKCR